jgi:hypothetical protein
MSNQTILVTGATGKTAALSPGPSPDAHAVTRFAEAVFQLYDAVRLELIGLLVGILLTRRSGNILCRGR